MIEALVLIAFLSACLYAMMAVACFLMFVTAPAPVPLGILVGLLWPVPILIGIFERRLERLARRLGFRDRIVSAFDPTTCIKRYDVSVTWWGSGTYRQFWTLRAAQEYFERVKDSAPHVTLSDEWFEGACGGGLTLQRQDNRERFPVPVMPRLGSSTLEVT